jgi:hypothetical protein
MNATLKGIAIAALLGCLPHAHAQSDAREETMSLAHPAPAGGQAARIAARFTLLAGSEENALALVEALREGAPVQLVAPDSQAHVPAVTQIDPPTGRMEWENVRIALALAQDALIRAGIARPCGDDLQAALLGGEVRKPDGSFHEMAGVLRMRADGLAWEQIARATAWKVLR